MLSIDRIQITRLFDEINYDIQLNQEEPISIITAPNGCGKTTVLNILSYVLNPTIENLTEFRGVPFERFTCIFSNGKQIRLEKIASAEPLQKSESTSRGRMNRDYRGSFSRLFGNYKYSVLKGNKSVGHIIFSEVIDEMAKLDPDILASDDEDYFYYRHNPVAMQVRYIEKRIIELLDKNEIHKPVNFIRANRIQPVTLRPQRPRDYDDDSRTESPLKLACDNISSIITKATEEYNTAVSSAKDSLPRMFLAGEGGNLDFDQFMDGWRAYSQELNRFQEIGLIAATNDFTKGKDIESVYNAKGAFLSTYLEAFRPTTTPLLEVYDRLKLFKDILDERNAITHKKAFFGKDGIILRAGDREIALETLSSGEKHDFIMFYNLIFNITKDGLVLIDEPEISLHIEWQDTYLDRLIAICKMNGLQAIVATHSPNIVSSHYDCLVDKGESHG